MAVITSHIFISTSFKKAFKVPKLDEAFRIRYLKLKLYRE